MIKYFVTFLLAASLALSGTTIRGKLFRVDSHNVTYPAQGISVRVVNMYNQPSAFVYSGSDGMYYLMEIPPGPYVLEVWSSLSLVQRFQINALPQQFTDIAPVRVP